MPHHRLQILLDNEALIPHFQPIVALGDGSVTGHEALIRTWPDCPWPHPDALFRHARVAGKLVALEMLCLRLSLHAWRRAGMASKLFLNLSPSGLMAAAEDGRHLMDLLQQWKMGPGRIVIELTEHERVQDLTELKEAWRCLRQHGVHFALDDFGDGRSSLRLWSELKPDIVKLDKYFTHQIHLSPEKHQTVRALLQISETFQTQVIAEGVESLEELKILKDMGVSFGQGWLLGMPTHPPQECLPDLIRQELQRPEISVYPHLQRTPDATERTRQLLVNAPPLPACATVSDVWLHFQRHRAAPGVALLQDGKIMGMLARHAFTTQYAQPYFAEVHGKSVALEFAVDNPLQIELETPVDKLIEILKSTDMSCLTDGFVMTENGIYKGLGVGRELVRTVTEARVESARHANPLTFLPGNLPIQHHLERLLKKGVGFTTCYADLNEFKAYNDCYGHWRGDQVIRLLAKVLQEHLAPHVDFLGHVGGDDFILLLQSRDWHARCLRAVQVFNDQVEAHYDEGDRLRGGLMTEDRQGQVRHHPLVTLRIGALVAGPDSGLEAEDVSASVTRAKALAKRLGLAIYVCTPNPDPEKPDPTQSLHMTSALETEEIRI